MSKLKSIITSQLFIFSISLIIFFVAAAFGWETLRYGFNFVDEGWHMTEAWRLTVGDHFLRDKITGAIELSSLINSMIFRITPDITLLEFRKIQYVLTIFSLLLLSTALYRTNKQYWYQPLIFSIFAFVGSDPIGMFPDLNYNTYPHLFVTLHLSFLLIGFYIDSKVVRRFLFVISGFFLWLISFCLLHTSLVLLSPLLYFYLLRKMKNNHFLFEAKDLLWIFIPILLCWILFISIFNVAYWENVIASLRFYLSSHAYSPRSLFFVHLAFFIHSFLASVGISTIFLVTFLCCLYKLRTSFLVPVILVLSLVMYVIIDTSFFNLLPYHPYYSRPIWFSSLIISVFTIFFFYIAGKIITHRHVRETELLATLLFIPCMLLSSSMSIISNISVCAVMYSSIPIIGGISILILSHENVRVKSYLIKFLILLIFFAPFYYSTAWSDWKNTGYDVSPEETNVEIAKGIGKGIRTNVAYSNLYNWIRETAQRYTTEDDYIISYVVSPMVHMITKRRPALEISWIDFKELTPEYCETAITRMEKSGRDPEIVFIFNRRPQIRVLTSLKKPEYVWWHQQLFPPFSDCISKYVAEHMHLIDTYKIAEGVFVYCYQRN
jgi:hypothetical protein